MSTRTGRLGGDSVGFMVVGAVVALVLSGTAMAVTDSAFTYSSVQTGRFTISPLDLAPAFDNAADDYLMNWTENVYLEAPDGCFTTGVHLPQKAKILNVQTYYRSGAGSNLEVFLTRNHLATDARVTLAHHYVTDDSKVRTSVTDPVPNEFSVVNNNLYTYGYAACLGIDTRFEGARITYEYTSAGD